MLIIPYINLGHVVAFGVREKTDARVVFNAQNNYSSSLNVTFYIDVLFKKVG